MSEAARNPYDLTDADHDYPARDGPPLRTILICTHPRSGSTLLGEALYFAGGLGCPLEYFHRGFRPGLAGRWGTAGIGQHIATVHRLRTDPGGTLSVKLFWRDIEDMAAELDPERFGMLQETPPGAVAPETYRAIAALLSEAFPNPSYVHLERRDRIRQAVSGLAAVQTNLWRVIADRDVQPAKGEADYDFDRIDGYIRYADFCHGHWRNFFAAIGVTPCTLSYEALVADYTGAVTGTLTQLGSDAAVPSARMRRQSDAINERLVLAYLRDPRRNRS
ncbi:Stf0 family sulfotransferase [Sphingomonas sp.]|uniref:Stf0 family sulfotransferase n=1 Tax=Sphingomonas sp. TaxID=28214 RepID=UPI003D6D0ACB